jgi:hypothetical protein
MNYNVSVLNTLAECDLIISESTADKNDLLIRKTGIETQVATSNNLSSVIPGQIVQVETQIAMRESALAAATDPDDKLNLEIELNSLRGKKLRLTKRLGSSDKLAILDKQFTLAKIGNEIASFDEYIIAIEARKTEIQNL